MPILRGNLFRQRALSADFDFVHHMGIVRDFHRGVSDELLVVVGRGATRDDDAAIHVVNPQSSHATARARQDRLFNLLHQERRAGGKQCGIHENPP